VHIGFKSVKIVGRRNGPGWGGEGAIAVLTERLQEIACNIRPTLKRFKAVLADILVKRAPQAGRRSAQSQRLTGCLDANGFSGLSSKAGGLVLMI
jgi:hypothetical protein